MTEPIWRPDWNLPDDPPPLNEAHRLQLEEIDKRKKRKPDMRGIYRR